MNNEGEMAEIIAQFKALKDNAEILQYKLEQGDYIHVFLSGSQKIKPLFANIFSTIEETNSLTICTE